MDYGNTATAASVDRVELRQADWVGASRTPEYDMQVWRTPTNTLTVTGTGQMALQAYAHGRWEHVLAFDVEKSSRDITIPERYTGRNINYKYHDGHISELGSLASLSGDAFFTGYRERWLEMSPANNAER